MQTRNAENRHEDTISHILFEVMYARIATAQPLYKPVLFQYSSPKRKRKNNEGIPTFSWPGGSQKWVLSVRGKRLIILRFVEKKTKKKKAKYGKQENNKYLKKST